MIAQAFASFVSGVVFALGLALSGMTQPAKIIGFLDVFGNWDQSLVFVLASAVGVYYLSFQIITKRKGPIIAATFQIPTKNDVDLRTTVGALIFGVGWGISGLCPGPILTTLATATLPVVILLVSMVVGLYIAPLIGRTKS
jgi:uncharacterized protein